jgi:uncharacterized membrane protein YuzA (DUF378 family)
VEMILNDRQITALAGEGMMTSKQIIRLIMGTVGICVALILSSCANSENRATGTETVKQTITPAPTKCRIVYLRIGLASVRRNRCR